MDIFDDHCWLNFIGQCDEVIVTNFSTTVSRIHGFVSAMAKYKTKRVAFRDCVITGWLSSIPRGTTRRCIDVANARRGPSTLKSIEYTTPLVARRDDLKLLCMRVFPLFGKVTVIAPQTTIDLAQFASAGVPIVRITCHKVVCDTPVPFIGCVQQLTIRVGDATVNAVLKRLHQQTLRYEQNVTVRVLFPPTKKPAAYHAWLTEFNTCLRAREQPHGIRIV